MGNPCRAHGRPGKTRQDQARPDSFPAIFSKLDPKLDHGGSFCKFADVFRATCAPLMHVEVRLLRPLACSGMQR